MKLRANRHKIQRGFTLIEMTVTLIVGMMVAAVALTLFNSQLTSYKILKAQNFLVREAPLVNNTLNRIVSRANYFRMYENMEDAIAGNNAVITNGKVLALKFQDPSDGTSSFGVIHFDEPADVTKDKRLQYYIVPSMAQLTGYDEVDPDDRPSNWNISKHIEDAVFYVENGVLRIRLTGPYGEEIIYSTTTQR